MLISLFFVQLANQFVLDSSFENVFWQKIIALPVVSRETALKTTGEIR